MKVAKEGLIFVAIAAALAAVTIFFAFSRQTAPLWMLAAVLTAVGLWVVYFFRDPERTGERGAALVVAPADGRVVMITEVNEPAFLHGRAMRVSIFMNVFNVHVNRYPISGTVRFVHYNPGKFLNAATEKSSLENEQLSVGLESNGTRVMVRQIAGLIARRIVNYSRESEEVGQGERMGIIRFGSRVDVFLPPSATVLVKVGDLTLAGVTIIARLT